MQKYIARRLLLAIPTLIGVTVMIFVVMRVIPGDPVSVVFGMEGFTAISPEVRAKLIEDLGLADPLIVQYFTWVKDIGTGKLGEAMLRGDKISTMVVRRGPITAEIALLSIVISWAVGLPVGIVSALKPHSVTDLTARFLSILFLAIPGFWLALLVVVALIDLFGYKSPVIPAQIWDDPWANFQMVIGPSVIVGLGMSAFIARMARSTLFEVIREDYVRTARSKGLAEFVVIARHALKNAFLPVITVSGWQLGRLIAGTVIIETIFLVPGVGRLLVDSIFHRDFTMIQGLVVLVTLMVMTVNLVVDMLYAVLDPRIRFA
jgi:peptide/nickel transport system permease protein